MEPIVIPFVSNNLGRVDFTADVMKSDYKSFGSVLFKLDSGSDFTTIDCADLDELGYTQDFLESRPFHPSSVSTASSEIRLQYITNVSVKFGNREIQGCRVFVPPNQYALHVFIIRHNELFFVFTTADEYFYFAILFQ